MPRSKQTGDSPSVPSIEFAAETCRSVGRASIGANNCFRSDSISPFIDATTLSLSSRLGALPNGKLVRFVSVEVNDCDALNEAQLIAPDAADSVLNLGGHRAIRVCRLGSTILWSPCIDNQFLLRWVSWTTMAFDCALYEAKFGASTSGLRSLDERESRFLAGLVLSQIEFPRPDTCEYCIPPAFDDPSGHSLVAKLRRGLFDDRATFQICEPPDSVGQVLIGHTAGESVLEWGLSHGRRCVRFAQPVAAPVWIHNPAIDETLRGLPRGESSRGR